MKDYLIKQGDCFEVERRLKEIDENYSLYFNKKKNRYEVYFKDELAVVCPFGEVDCRLIKYVRQTRTQRSESLFKEIEEHNEKINRELNKKQEEKNRYEMIEKLNRLKKQLG